MISINLAVPLITMVFIPGSAAFLLLGPLREKGRTEVLRLWFGYVAVAIMLAGLAAVLRPSMPLNAALAIAALALGPVTGTMLGLRTEGVKHDARMAFILGPLGYLAGCALAVRAMMGLGFGVPV
jgi:hypothetical protein